MHVYSQLYTFLFPPPTHTTHTPGNVESTEPTKSLMRIAECIDTCDHRDSLRPWFINNQTEVLELLTSEEAWINRQKEKREEEGGVAGLATQSGLRRWRKRKVGGVSHDQESSKSSADLFDPLEKVNIYSCVCFIPGSYSCFSKSHAGAETSKSYNEVWMPV